VNRRASADRRRWAPDSHTRIRRITLGATWLLLSCSRGDSNTVALPNRTPSVRGEDAPVMINPVSPVEYPPALFARGIEGKVILGLYADETGRLLQDSTRIAESSGYPALDSAAVAAVAQFRFAPALRNGTPVATSFLQPVHFRHPQAGGTSP